MNIGIDLISYYTPSFYLDLKVLAELYHKDVAAYYEVLGQERMAVVPPDEDIVSFGANAASRITLKTDISKIKTLFFATESGIDQSKSAGMYLHKLLGLSPQCRVVELKQACYSGTIALQMAVNQIKAEPETECLVVCADIARYGLGSPGEPTQGAGACAFLVKANPRILKIEEGQGYYAEDAMDFWRPNYRDEAFVDGQYSVRLYIKTMQEAWKSFKESSRLSLNQLNYFCFHLPFTTMAEKAFQRLAKAEGQVATDADIQTKVNPSLRYNRITGNCYTGSLYQSLCSLLDSKELNLGGTRAGFFSYGSGAMAEMFSGQIQSNYKDVLFTAEHEAMFNSRKSLSYDEYKSFYNFILPRDGRDFNTPRHTQQAFRLSGIQKHKRLYDKLR